MLERKRESSSTRRILIHFFLQRKHYLQTPFYITSIFHPHSTIHIGSILVFSSLQKTIYNYISIREKDKFLFYSHKKFVFKQKKKQKNVE